MWSRTQSRSASLAFAAALVCALPASAQIPRSLKRCLPYPTLADEISDMHQEVESKAAALVGAGKPQPKIVIDDVRFDGTIHLDDSIREQLVSHLKESRFDANSAWLQEVTEVSIRGTWQDQGFFKAVATARTQIISNDPGAQRVLLIVHVDEGLRYRLGNIEFRSVDPYSPLVFSDEQLRALIPIREGELFSVDKIRKALDAIMKLYGTYGYIDFVVSPTTNIADDRPRISLVMEMQQGRQYRVGKIEVFSSNPAIETALKTKLHSGDVFNSQLIQDFLAEKKLSLPPDVSMSDVSVHRNVKSGKADLRLNFQTCPQVQN